MKSLRRLSAVLIAAIVVATPAFACKGGQELFSDDFSAPDSAWRSHDDFSIFAGRMRLRPPAGAGALIVYEGGSFRDADICVDVTIPESRNQKAVHGGLIFWSANREEFYVFEITADGRAAVSRRHDGKWSSLVPFKRADGFKPGGAAATMLRLTLKGNNGAAYVNDEAFSAFTGQPPRDGGLIGFFGRSEPYVANIWTFANLKITK